MGVSILEARFATEPGFFFWPNYEWMNRCGMEPRKGHPGSLGLTRFLPGNQSPGRGFLLSVEAAGMNVTMRWRR